MARIETDPNYTTPTFSRATAATDLFKKEDVQNLASAFSTHVHDGTGKGLPILVTSAMIQDKTILAGDIADGIITLNSSLIADGAINAGKMQPKTIGNPQIADGSLTTTLFADGNITYSKLAPNAATNVNYYYANPGNSTTSSSFVAIPGLSFALNLAGGMVHFVVTMPLYSNAAAGVYLGVNFNGGGFTAISYVNLPAGALTSMVTGQFVWGYGALGSGNTTFGVGWLTTAGTLTQNGAAPTIAVVTEYRR